MAWLRSAICPAHDPDRRLVRFVGLPPFVQAEVEATRARQQLEVATSERDAAEKELERVKQLLETTSAENASMELAAQADRRTVLELQASADSMADKLARTATALESAIGDLLGTQAEAARTARARARSTFGLSDRAEVVAARRRKGLHTTDGTTDDATDDTMDDTADDTTDDTMQAGTRLHTRWNGAGGSAASMPCEDRPIPAARSIPCAGPLHSLDSSAPLSLRRPRLRRGPSRRRWS